MNPIEFDEPLTPFSTPWSQLPDVHPDKPCEEPPPNPLATTWTQPTAPVVPPPWPLVPGYEILGELGRGGMAIVYKARQLRANRAVALKMLLPGAPLSQDRLTRFRLEAEAVARLQHPHIVQIFEVGEHNGQPYFSLEYCSGGSLEQFLRGTTLTALDAAALVEILARAMHHAHLAGILHRDLKPGNVLLQDDLSQTRPDARTPTPRPKVSDFGLAKRLDDDAGQSRTGQMLGTPAYMAPEQALGRVHDIGPAADVWALGGILYECLFGRPPFLGATRDETLLRVVHHDPVPLRQLDKALPRDLETICLYCLHKEPQRRYASALELAEDLRRFQANEPIVARPVSRWERTRKWARRRPALASLIVLAVVALVAGVGGGIWHTRQLEEQIQRVEAARRRADDERSRAAASRDRVAEVVQALWASTVKEDVLMSEEETSANYEKTAAALETYLSQQPESLQIEVMLSKTYSNLANLYRRHGKARESEQTYGKALALQEALLRRPLAADVRPQVAAFLIRSYKLLGNLHDETGATDKGERAYRTGLQLGMTELVGEGVSAARLQELAEIHCNLGNLLRQRRDVRAALDEYRRALIRYDDIERAFPGARSHRAGLALVCCNMGHVRNETQAAEEGLKLHQRGLAIRQELARLNPGNPEILDDLAISQCGVANAYRLSKKPDLVSAERHCREALRIKEALVRDHPGVGEYRARLAATQANLALILIDQKKDVEAFPVLAQSASHLEAVLRSNTYNQEAREHLALVLDVRAGLYQKHGQPMKADNDRRQARQLRR